MSAETRIQGPATDTGGAVLTNPDSSASQGGTLTGLFAQFDPRIDGLSASVGTRWSATDCPMVMVKIGEGNTDWIISGEGQVSALAACETFAQIQALYRGLARQPNLDMTPSHLLTPDLANNRLSDVAGDHLTIQGAGAGAAIERSPLYDNLSPFGYQARVTIGNASYFAASDPGKYDFNGPFVIGWIQSCTVDAAGGVSLGKWRPAPGQDRGYAISLNSFGGFGFLINGALLNLNTDTPFGTPPVNDGRLRVFHHGFSALAGGKGFVRTAGIAPVEQNGNPGAFSNNDALFGILQTAGGGALTAQGNQQYQKMVVWTGAAAENVIANLEAVEDGLQAQLGTSIVEGTSINQNINPTVAARAFNAPFVPSVSSPILCLYSCRILTAGNDIGRIEIRADLGVNPPVTVRGVLRRQIQAGAFPDSIDGQLCFLAPPGWTVEIVTVAEAGAPVFSFQAQCEEAILP